MSIKRIVQNIKDFFLERKNTFHVESIILPENENMRNELTKILWAYFKTNLAKKRRKQKIFNVSVFTASCLSLIFVSLIIFSSLNEIEAGTFDFLDAVVQIGKKISISRKGENNSDIPPSAIDTPAIAASYDTLDSLLSQQDAKLMLPGYMPEGINAIRYTFWEDSNSNTILITYENTLTTECVTYRSSFELPANELAGFLVDRPTGLSLPKLPPQSLRFFFYPTEEIVLLSEYLY